jgi:hypothetical protein
MFLKLEANLQDTRNSIKILVGKLYHLGDPDVDRRIMLKSIYSARDWFPLFWAWIGTRGGLL